MNWRMVSRTARSSGDSEKSITSEPLPAFHLPELILECEPSLS
jgi:hypothetical protein